MKNEMIAKVLKELRKRNSMTVHDVVVKLSDNNQCRRQDALRLGERSGSARCGHAAHSVRDISCR